MYVVIKYEAISFFKRKFAKVEDAVCGTEAATVHLSYIAASLDSQFSDLFG